MEHTMHAMMSDRESRACGIMYAKTITGLMEEAAVAALGEAATILAVAEPESVQPIRTVCHEPAHVYAHRGAFGYMADALGAFLAAPDPAAYLAQVAR